MRLTLSLVLLLVGTASIHANEFARYPAERKLDRQPAKVRLNTKRAKMFRTVLRSAAQEGPNFNGRYRIAHWGCGTNCIEWAVINLETGAVWFAPKPAFSCWSADEPANVKVPDWFVSRLDSRLFYVHQCSRTRTDRTFDRRMVYVWSEGTAKLLRVEKLQ